MIDNKLLISGDSTIEYLLYYDIRNKNFIKCPYNKKFISNPLEISTILNNKNSIFLISFTGEIIKLNRKTLAFEKVLKLKNKIIVSGDIKDSKIYLVGQNKENGQIASIDVIDSNNLKQIKESSIEPIRDTMVRDIFIYK